MPTDFQAKMLKYIKYGISMKTTAAEGVDYFLVTITINPKWKIVEPSDGKGVSCVYDNSNNGTVYYFTPIENGMDVIFDCIEETIQYNEEAEKKVELLKEKIYELQELFVKESYDYLKNIEFTYVPPKKKKGQSKKNGSVESKEVVTVQEETTPIVKPVEEEVTVVENVDRRDKFEVKPNKTENNQQEANEIDAKIAAALGKK